LRRCAAIDGLLELSGGLGKLHLRRTQLPLRLLAQDPDALMWVRYISAHVRARPPRFLAIPDRYVTSHPRQHATAVDSTADPVRPLESQRFSLGKCAEREPGLLRHDALNDSIKPAACDRTWKSFHVPVIARARSAFSSATLSNVACPRRVSL